MVALVLAPILIGVLTYWLPFKAGRVLTLVTQFAMGALVVYYLNQVLTYGVVYDALGGADRNLYVSLRGTPTGLTLIALMVVLFTAALIYVVGEPYTSKMLLLLLSILQGLVAGLFLTDDIFNLFVLFEVASVVTIVLVVFRRDRRNVYDGLFYLMIQIVAMLFFLFGTAYLYRSFGVLNLSAISEMIAAGADPRALVLPFAFLLTGLALKAGLFPLFSYVPRSYGNPGAPTAVMMLMSGALVTAALFWIARLIEVFTPALNLAVPLLVLGVLTGVAGAVKALAEQDIRLILAYSTVSQAGLILTGFAAGGAAGTTGFDGGMLHLVNHAVLKSVLFLAAGMVVRSYGTANLAEIRGTFRRLPWSSGAAAFAMLALIGTPLTGAAASKDLIGAGISGWAVVAFWVLNGCTALIFIKYSAMLFGRPVGPLSPPRPLIDPVQRAVVVALAVVALALGVLVTPFADLLLQPDDGGVAAVATLAVTSAKVLTFGLVVLGAFAVRRATVPHLHRDSRLLRTSLSFPQSVLMLALFFAAVVIAGTVVSR